MKLFAPNAWKQLKASFKKIMKNEKGQSVDCPFLLNKNRLFQQKFFKKDFALLSMTLNIPRLFGGFSGVEAKKT